MLLGVVGAEVGSGHNAHVEVLWRAENNFTLGSWLSLFTSFWGQDLSCDFCHRCAVCVSFWVIRLSPPPT